MFVRLKSGALINAALIALIEPVASIESVRRVPSDKIAMAFLVGWDGQNDVLSAELDADELETVIKCIEKTAGLA